MIYMAIVLIWGIIGVGSFIYWWTQEYNLTTDETPEILACFCIGPIAYVLGRFIHSKSIPKVLMKRRGSK